MAEAPSTNQDRLASQRKIELQSHADLTFLQQNLAKAARSRLDLHFPTAAALRASAPAEVISLGQNVEEPVEEEDAMRARVRVLVDEFLANTFQQAAHGISVNGIDATALTSTIPNCTDPEPRREVEVDTAHEVEGIHYSYEAFDSGLQRKLASLHGELEGLTAQVSKLRREAPRNAAEKYQRDLQEALRKDDEAWVEWKVAKGQEEVEGLHLDTVDGWHDEVKEMFGLGVQKLAVVSGVRTQEGEASLTETMGKMRRAVNVAQEFE